VTGAWPLLLFMLRRERWGLPGWIAVVALFLFVQSRQSQRFYGTDEELATLRATVESNAALVAFAGPAENLRTVGGEVMYEIAGYLAIVVALMNMVLVARHTRSDEEANRTELVRSGRVGKLAVLAAALGLALVANVAVALVILAVGVVTGLPLAGSVLFGLALGSIGLFFASATALAAQVLENARGVYAGVAALVGASFAFRAAGDVRGGGFLSWLSPIGWLQRTFPYTDDRWWVLLVPLVGAAGLAVGAVALLERRDLGAGLVAARPGRGRAAWALSSVEGLAWRLQRASLIGWLLGSLLLGFIYGSVTESIQQFVDDNPELADFLPGGGGGDVVDAYLAVTLSITALLATAAGIAGVLRARGEETAGRAEPLLATPTSRSRWLGSHLVLGSLGSAAVLVAGAVGVGVAHGVGSDDPGQIGRLALASLAYLAPVWVVVSLVPLGFGLWPRLAAAAAWAALAFVAVVAFFGDTFDLPGWLTAVSPFDHVAQVPLDDVTVVPLVVLVGLAAIATTAGLVGLRRRDLDVA
jgi:ABC-2 type transport system permease protein